MITRGPFGWWPEGRKAKLWGWVLAVTTVGVGLVLAVCESKLKDAGAGIVDFELARNFNRSFEILAGWTEADVIATAKASVLVDFGFLVLYATTLGVATAGLGRRLGARGFGRAARWAPGVAWAVVAAALLDAAENVCLWLQLTDGARRVYALPAFTFASVKFALLGLAVGYLVVGGLASLRRGTELDSA